MDKIENVLKHFNKISFRGPLAFLIVLCSFAFLFMLLYRTVPSANRDLVALAAGFVLGMAKDVSGWFFGSSKGKEDGEKTAQLKELLTAEKTTTTTTTETPKDTPPAE